MTKRRDFKALVRERMDKTGERYTAARAQVLGKTTASPTPNPFPGVLPGYKTFGGIQSGTAALRNLLTSIGAVSPIDGAPVLGVARQRPLRRAGIPLRRLRVQGMAAPLVARTAQPLDARRLHRRGRVAYRTQGDSQRDHESRRRAQGARCRARRWQGGSVRDRRRVAALDGIAGGLRRRRAARRRRRRTRWRRLLDRRPGRASQAHQRGAAVEGARRVPSRQESAGDVRRPVTALRGDAARSATRSRTRRSATSSRPCPSPSGATAASPASRNGGRCSSMRRTSAAGRRSLPTAHARVPDCSGSMSRSNVNRRRRPGGASMPTSSTTRREPSTDRRLARAATAYREAGALWSTIGNMVATCDDATIRKVCAAADTRLEDEDTGRDAASPSCADRVQELQKIAADCKLTRDAARALYAEIAAVVGRIDDAERAAVDHMKAAVAKH